MNTIPRQGKSAGACFSPWLFDDGPGAFAPAKPSHQHQGGIKTVANKNDSSRLPSAPPFPDIANALAVQRYFGEEGLNFSRFDNERKFTLAFYKLIFQECAKNPDEYEHDKVTLQYCDALWRRNPSWEYQTTRLVTDDNEEQYQATCSVRFDVTLKDEGLMTCYVFIYPYQPDWGFCGGIGLGVHVENAQKEVVNALQLDVSKPGWENIWNDEGQYWEIYSNGSMARMGGKGIKREEVLSAVRIAERDRWIKKPSWSKGKEQVHLGNLPVAEKVTWENSRNFLAQLLHYAIIRAKIKFSRAK